MTGNMSVPFCRGCRTYGYLDNHNGEPCYKCRECERILVRNP